MPTSPPKDFYNEMEAAEALKISVIRLHMLLDQYVFNDGSPKPAKMRFRPTDLVMLGFWDQNTPNSKVVSMPRLARG
jgi:hypothetical protein